MPRIRTLKPEFWGDEKLSACSPLTRLVFLGLISQADDAGRLIDKVKTIDGMLFPETDDTCAPALDELAQLGRIERYVTSSGQRLIQIVNWTKHQKVDHPSRYVLPGPAEEVVAPQENPKPSDNPPEDHAKPSRESRAPTLDLGPTTNDQGNSSADKSAGEQPRSVTPSKSSNGRAADELQRNAAAVLIRKHLWLGDHPPPNTHGPDGEPWEMGNELSIWKHLSAQHGPDDVNAAIPFARKKLGFKRDEPLTMRIFNVRGRRDALNECITASKLATQKNARNGVRSAAELIDRKAAADA